MNMSNAFSADAFSKRRQYKRKRKLRAASIICVFVFIAFAAAILIITQTKTGVTDSITVEAGSDPVKAASFFERSAPNAAFVSGGDVDTHVPGVYEIKVRNGVLIYNVTLTVEDTVAPTAKPRNVRITKGEKTPAASDFVRDISDESEVSVSFKEPVDYTVLGDRQVTVVLTDLGGNTAEYTGRLTVFPPELKKSITVEAGGDSLAVQDFLSDGSAADQGDSILTQAESIKFNEVGSNDIELMYKGVVYTVTLEVEDTKAPGGYIINQTAYRGSRIPASDFVKTVYDETEVDISYKTEPDFGKVGSQKITLVLKDDGGNTREYAATLYVREDETPPVITAANRTVYFGDNIRFSDGVKAVDNNDGEVKVSVDTSKFVRDEAGAYPVTFSAEDSAGNRSSKTVIFTLKKKPAEYVYSQEYINSEFNALYDRIITGSMTKKQKMRAIYDYIRENISYTGTSDKSSDWEQEALRAYRSKGGDSWSFYALSRKLLTMAGVDNKEMERTGSDSFHYWNLVEYEGEWYHFDTCPHYKDYPIDSFMLTEEQAKAYSEKTGGYYDHK